MRRTRSRVLPADWWDRHLARRHRDIARRLYRLPSISFASFGTLNGTDYTCVANHIHYVPHA